MHARRLIVTLVFAAILVGFFIWLTTVLVDDAVRKKRIWRQEAAKVTAAVDAVNAQKMDIMLFGTPVDAPQGLTCRRIYDLELESLAASDANFDHDGHVLILNDPLGELPMTEERWKQVYDLWRNDGYVIVYFGTAQLEAMQKAGFFFDEYPPETKSAIFWNYGNSHEIGFADDPSILPEVVREELAEERIPIFTMVMKMAGNKEYLQSES